MKKLCLGAILFLMLGSVAQEIFLGGGVVSEAKLSRVAPKIADFDADHFAGLPERKIYAMLTIDVPKTRKISIFDYQLRLFGRDYACVALREEGGAWKTTTQILPGGKRYSLLFILNAGMVGVKDQEVIALKNCGSQDQTPISFQNLRDTAF